MQYALDHVSSTFRGGPSLRFSFGKVPSFKTKLPCDNSFRTLRPKQPVAAATTGIATKR